jgi:tRNA pseudouridine38-40 synthase
MRTILLLLEFDGTSYAGWQRQSNAKSIQQVVENTLAQILGQSVSLHSSGRTDAGVHAKGLAAHFRSDTNLPLTAFREGLNSLLPGDIAVKGVLEMPPDFHARYSAKGKWYRYTIYQAKVRSPLAARTSWQVSEKLDIKSMKNAARNLIGKHDFSGFRTSGCAAQKTVREIFDIQIISDNSYLYIDVKGSGFLKNMVRMIVGTLVEIGRCRRPVEDIQKILLGEEGIRSGPTAPAHGLCLEEVWF